MNMLLRDSENIFLKDVPKSPGVYKYYAINKRILYVGKAKKLHNRVRQYFVSPEKNTMKVQKMVSQVRYIDFIVTENETEALLLENSIIKELQPKYNILLRDGKSYPWICIKEEPFPRVFSTRHIVKDGSKYFGPYSSVVLHRGLLELVHKLYPLRNCSLKLTQENIKAQKFSKCLEYDIGNCKGPCIDEFGEEEYQQNVSEITDLLSGNLHKIKKQMEERMLWLAEKMNYKKAQRVKEQLAEIDKFQSKSLVVSSTIGSVDVFSIHSSEAFSYVNFLKVFQGSVVNSHSISIKKKMEESDEDILLMVIPNLRRMFQSEAKEVLLPIMPQMEYDGLKFTVPKIGDKKKLLDFSYKNLRFFIQSHKTKISLPTPQEERTRENLEQLKKDLSLKNLPEHIECFDNSNIQGTNPVSACVVFKNGLPSKTDYRIFNIKTVSGPDDFKSMKEGLMRRYSRLINEKKPMPQLIIIDGGKGQLSASVEVLEALGLYGRVEIIGIAKRLEEIFKPYDAVPLYLDKRSISLKIIQHCRDEAHRFSLKHHRMRRSKSQVKSELDNVPGIGTKTKQKLIKDFKSVSNIKKQTFDALLYSIGKSKAEILWTFFKNKL